MCCDCGVMDFDVEDTGFMMGPSNLNVYGHSFINTSTIETTKWGSHKRHNRKYMEVEGPSHDLLEHYLQWAELLAYQEDNIILG